MSATATLRPTEITDRALENRFMQNRYLENRYMESKLYQADSRFFEVSNRFIELADRLWMADLDDAAALLEIEERVAESRYFEI